MMRAGRRGGAVGLVLGLALAVLPQANAVWVKQSTGQHARARYAATFPASCTQGQASATFTRDTYVKQDTPTADNGASATLSVGQAASGSTQRWQRIFIQFTKPSIPTGCAVTSAVLTLQRTGSGTFFGGRSYIARGVQSSWTSSLNWTQHLSLTYPTGTAPGSACCGQSTALTFQVKDIYATATNGFIIWDNAEPGPPNTPATGDTNRNDNAFVAGDGGGGGALAPTLVVSWA